MAEVDINNNSIKRFAVFHHRFDPETNHFRWIGIKAFSNQREWKKYLATAMAELAIKHEANETLKEQISGRILEAESTENNATIRNHRSTLWFLRVSKMSMSYLGKPFQNGGGKASEAILLMMAQTEVEL
ncbi:MAG: hypothetical protein HY050_10030 [Actinobacteria bacterium]|nr:hypothetical protein [Actinomycetota bacterium]